LKSTSTSNHHKRPQVATGGFCSLDCGLSGFEKKEKEREASWPKERRRTKPKLEILKRKCKLKKREVALHLQSH
jgi:hypothetical protein